MSLIAFAVAAFLVDIRIGFSVLGVCFLATSFLLASERD